MMGQARIRVSFDLFEEILKGSFDRAVMSDAPPDLRVISFSLDTYFPRCLIVVVESDSYPEFHEFTASGQRPFPPFVEVTFSNEERPPEPDKSVRAPDFDRVSDAGIPKE